MQGETALQGLILPTRVHEEPEYSTIEQRKDFYSWFQGATAERGFETKWAGAASQVSGAVAVMDDMFGSISSDVENFANEGNRMIFEDVFPKLRGLSSGPVLKGDAAFKWDAKTLSQEQHLVQPLYEEAKKNGSFGFIELLSKSPVGSAMGIPPFKGDLMKPSDRWSYGMGNMGYPPAEMPAP